MADFPIEGSSPFGEIEMRQVTRRLAAASAALLLSGLSAFAAAAPVTYQLTPVTAGTSLINGVITVTPVTTIVSGFITVDDGPTVGQVFAPEIVDWRFTASGGVNFDIRKSDAGSYTSCAAVEPCFTIVGDSLLFDFGPRVVAGDPFHNFQAGTPAADVLLKNSANLFSVRSNSPLSVAGVQPLGLTAVATANNGGTPLPEPSSLGLVVLALSAAVWRRNWPRRTR